MHKKSLVWTYRISIIISILAFIALIVVASMAPAEGDELYATTISSYDTLIMLFLISTIVAAFLAGVVYSIQDIMHQDADTYKNNTRLSIIKRVAVRSIFLPLILVYRLFVRTKVETKSHVKEEKDSLPSKKISSRAVLKKIGRFFFIVCIMLPLWVGVGGVIYYAASNFVQHTGIFPYSEDVVGTGSMYPTWPKGTLGKSNFEHSQEIVGTAKFSPYSDTSLLFKHTLERGDIITFENDVVYDYTRDEEDPPDAKWGLLKRLIALPGDTIMLQGGIVYLNDKPLAEPYVAKPRSTFGGEKIQECKKYTIPPGMFFAMGDNRKGSGDTRDIGFQPIADIGSYISLKKQKGTLDKNWHDTTHDLDASAEQHINVDRLVTLLNEKRKEAGKQPLSHDSRLDTSARIRANEYFRKGSFDSYDTDDMEYAFTSAGLHGEMGELYRQGFYDETEIVEDYLYGDSNDRAFFLDNSYNKIGVAEVKGTINGCPTQFIFIHLYGYVPASYAQEDIASWHELIKNLEKDGPSWHTLIEDKNDPFYKAHKADAERVNEIISLRLSRARILVKKMENKEWLTSEENRYIDQDSALGDEMINLETKLNNAQ